MNRNQVKRTVKEVAGKLQQKVGEVTGARISGEGRGEAGRRKCSEGCLSETFRNR